MPAIKAIFLVLNSLKVKGQYIRQKVVNDVSNNGNFPLNQLKIYIFKKNRGELKQSWKSLAKLDFEKYMQEKGNLSE